MARRVGGGTRRATFEKQFEFFRKETASWEMKSLARPLRGLASRFSGKFQAVLNSA